MLPREQARHNYEERLTSFAHKLDLSVWGKWHGVLLEEKGDRVVATFVSTTSTLSLPKFFATIKKKASPLDGRPAIQLLNIELGQREIASFERFSIDKEKRDDDKSDVLLEFFPKEDSRLERLEEHESVASDGRSLMRAYRKGPETLLIQVHRQEEWIYRWSMSMPR